MPPSVNPITIKINEWMFTNYLNNFMLTYLPAYTWRQTSKTRTRAQNEAAGGVEDSAHLYGLAEDGNLVNTASGDIISEAAGRQIFDEYFKPYWEGYAEFEPSIYSAGVLTKRWHIHLHIDRGLNDYTKWAGIALGALGGAIAVKKFIKEKGK